MKKLNKKENYGREINVSKLYSEKDELQQTIKDLRENQEILRHRKDKHITYLKTENESLKKKNEELNLGIDDVCLLLKHKIKDKQHTTTLKSVRNRLLKLIQQEKKK